MLKKYLAKDPNDEVLREIVEEEERYPDLLHELYLRLDKKVDARITGISERSEYCLAKFLKERPYSTQAPRDSINASKHAFFNHMVIGGEMASRSSYWATV